MWEPFKGEKPPEWASESYPLYGAPRELREGEVMMVYMEFDRHADKTVPPVEYLIQYGQAVSRATVEANV